MLVFIVPTLVACAVAPGALYALRLRRSDRLRERIGWYTRGER